MTTPEYDAACGMCHPGGGPMERDREGNFLHEKSLSEIEAALSNGEVLGDYTVWSPKEKRFVPFVWTISAGNETVNNTLAPNCFMCHSSVIGSQNPYAPSSTFNMPLLSYRLATFKLRYFSGAGTLSSGIATLNPDNTFNYNLAFDADNATAGLQVDGSFIVHSNDMHCSQCHGGGWDDFDGDGRITKLDFLLQVKDLRYLQPDGLKEAKVWFFNETITDGNYVSSKVDGSLIPVPKNVDVHRWARYVGDGNVKGCVDCHAPVKHDYIGTGYFPDVPSLIPSHDFAKGNAGPAFTVRWHQLAGSASCERCHENPVGLHSRAFGPAAAEHLEKVACTTCHIPKKYFFEAKLIDWTLPMFVVSGDSNGYTFLGLTKNVYVGGDSVNGTPVDVALFPIRDFSTGEVVWKLSAANAMGVLFFADNSEGTFRPVIPRYLAKVFGLSYDLPTRYIIEEVDSSGKPVRVGSFGHLVLKVKSGVISQDSDLAAGGWRLINALPNFIDVDQDGAFTPGVDVQITDDTGLDGSPDGVPEINTQREVSAALSTVKKVVSGAVGRDVEVKLIATAIPFGVSHNVRPAPEALRCDDCHGGRESELQGAVFTRKVNLYFPFDPAVENSTAFVPKVQRTLTEYAFADWTRREIESMGFPAAILDYSTVKVEVDGEVIATRAQTEEAASALGVSAGDLIAAVAVAPSDNPFKVLFEIKEPLSDYGVKVVNGTVTSKVVSGNRLEVQVAPASGRSVVVGLVKEVAGSGSSAGVSSGGGGCSFSPSGPAGLLSYLPAAVALALLRRRRRLSG